MKNAFERNCRADGQKRIVRSASLIQYLKNISPELLNEAVKVEKEILAGGDLFIWPARLVTSRIETLKRA
jgi:hypothetical protein